MPGELLWLYTPEQLDELREEMGLNQPRFWSQYGTLGWGMRSTLTLGPHWVNGRSVFGRGVPRNGRHTEHCIDSGGH